MKVALLDHMGYGNLGDAATQDALMANIEARLPDVQFIGFSLNPLDTKRRHNITCYPINWWYPTVLDSDTCTDGISRRSGVKALLKVVPILGVACRRLLYLYREIVHLSRSLRVLRSLDILIIAGGGQLSELWGGAWAHPYNVFKFSVLAKVARKRLFFLNVGAGPLGHRLSRLFVRGAVGLADYVSFRDQESQTLVRRAGVTRNTHVFPDSAYSLDVSQYQISRARGIPPRLVGINPIGFCDPRIWPKKDQSQYCSYLDKLTVFCAWLITQRYRIRIFSSEKSVDCYALNDLNDRITAALGPDRMDHGLTPPSLSVTDLLVEMAGVDFVVSSKFHGVVFSHLLAKPVIALSYHPKIDDLMRAVGQSEYCLDIETFDTDTLRTTFASLVDNTPDLTARVRRTVSAYSRALRSQFDELFAQADTVSGSTESLRGVMSAGQDHQAPPQ